MSTIDFLGMRMPVLTFTLVMVTGITLLAVMLGLLVQARIRKKYGNAYAQIARLMQNLAAPGYETPHIPVAGREMAAARVADIRNSIEAGKDEFRLDLEVFVSTGGTKQMSFSHGGKAADGSPIVTDACVYVSFDAQSYENARIDRILGVLR